LIDLISTSDVLISDYSGAIFESILAYVPVVLVDIDPHLIESEKKINPHSLEIARRDEIGFVAQPGKLRQAIKQVFDGGGSAEFQGIDRAELFANTSDPLVEMIAALKDLAAGRITPNAKQIRARSCEIKRINARRRKKIALNCLAFICLTIFLTLTALTILFAI